MSWFLVILFLSLTFCSVSEASHHKKVPSALVVGTVYCDTCFQNDFSFGSHFISGASVGIECKDGKSKPRFKSEVKTNEHGEFKVKLPFSVSKNAKRIKGCSLKLISSNDPYCAVASTTTSSSLKLKSTNQKQHIFSTGFFSFKPIKKPKLCNQKPKFSDKKFFFPTIPFFPPLVPNPFQPPLVPNPFQPPLIPNPFQPPPVIPNPFQPPPPLIPNPFQPPSPPPLFPNPFQPPSPPPLFPNPFQPPSPPPFIPNPFQPPPSTPPPLIPNPFQPPPSTPSPSFPPLFPFPPIPGLTKPPPPPPPPPPFLPFPFPPLFPPPHSRGTPPGSSLKG